MAAESVDVAEKVRVYWNIGEHWVPTKCRAASCALDNGSNVDTAQAPRNNSHV